MPDSVSRGDVTKGGDETSSFEIMRLTDLIDHGSDGTNLGLSDGPSWLNIKDHSVIGIDK